MDIEQKQEELIDHFVKQASSLSGSALASVVAEATSHPSLFAFSEILAVPNVLQLEGTENTVYLDLHMAHGVITRHASESQRKKKIGPKLLTSIIYGSKRQLYDYLSNQRADLEINEELCARFSFLSKIWR